MSIFSEVKRKIQRLPKGEIISLGNFRKFANKKAVTFALSKLKRSGDIERLEKGKYYVPENSKFGILGPSDRSIVETLLREVEGGYVSGLSSYNKLGLTTQIPNEITIVGKRYGRKTSIGKLKIKYVRRRTPIRKKENIAILQILDAVNDLKRIPDTPTTEVLKILKKEIQSLPLSVKKEMINVSRYYRPFVMALIGEIFEEEGIKEVQKLRSLINPLTVFKVGIPEKILPLKKNWNLV